MKNSPQQDNKQVAEEKDSKSNSIENKDEDIDKLNGSIEDFIVEYRIKEQKKHSQSDSDGQQEAVNDDDDDDDANLQRILKQISVSLHNKYRNVDQSSTKLSTMVQELYQTLKRTRPHLFTKTPRINEISADNSNSEQLSTDANSNKESEEGRSNDDDDSDDNDEIISLTPEMEQANKIYHEAMKLINVTINRQYQK